MHLYIILLTLIMTTELAEDDNSIHSQHQQPFPPTTTTSSTTTTTIDSVLALQSWRYGYLAFACNYMKYQLYLLAPKPNATKFGIELGFNRASELAEAVFRIRTISRSGRVQIQSNSTRKFVCVDKRGNGFMRQYPRDGITKRGVRFWCSFRRLNQLNAILFQAAAANEPNSILNFPVIFLLAENAQLRRFALDMYRSEDAFEQCSRFMFHPLKLRKHHLVQFG